MIGVFPIQNRESGISGMSGVFPPMTPFARARARARGISAHIWEQTPLTPLLSNLSGFQTFPNATLTDRKLRREDSMAINTSEADLEAKCELFRQAYQAFAELYEPRDFVRFPWLDEGLREVESEDGLSVEAIRGRLRELYLRYKRAKAGK